MTASAVEESDQMINRFVKSKLRTGEIVIWSEGDDNILSGRNTKKVKKILEKHQIPFTEIIIN